MRTTDEELHMLKTVEFYSANVNAWVATKFERDKSLLSLSTGSIGLLLTLISTVGVKSVEALILYILALICFLLCLVCVLCIFKQNAKYLQKVITEESDSDNLLKILDGIAVFSFVLGVAFASIIACSTAVQSYIDKANTMTDTKKTNIVRTELELRKSLNDITLMSPSGPKTGSTEGIHNLRPKLPATTPAAAPTEKPKDSK